MNGGHQLLESEDDTARQIRRALADCEATVCGEVDDAEIQGWIGAMREGIEAKCAPWTPSSDQVLQRRASVAHSIATSRVRESVLRARARGVAGNIIELRERALRIVDAQVDALPEAAVLTPTPDLDDDDVPDVAPFVAQMRANVDTVLKVAAAAPPRIERIRALVDTVAADQALGTKTKRARRHDAAQSADPADVLARHLSTPPSLSAFLAVPQPPTRRPPATLATPPVPVPRRSSSHSG